MRSFASALSVRRSVGSGRMPERSIGTDCKSVRLTPYEGSNPSPTTIFFFWDFPQACFPFVFWLQESSGFSELSRPPTVLGRTAQEKNPKE